MGKPPRHCLNILPNIGFYIMVISALIATMISIQGPAFEYVTYTYELQHRDVQCSIDGYHLGSEFGKALHNYSLLVGVLTATCNLMMVKSIRKFRTTGSFSPTFCFFFLIVLPIRLINFALQMIEFNVIGGRSYTWLLANAHMYPNCELFSGHLDAILLMHVRALFLTLDFITLNTMILTVSFVYSTTEETI